MKKYKVRVKTPNELGYLENLYWRSEMKEMSGGTFEATPSRDNDFLVFNSGTEDSWFFLTKHLEIIQG